MRVVILAALLACVSVAAGLAGCSDGSVTGDAGASPVARHSAHAAHVVRHSTHAGGGDRARNGLGAAARSRSLGLITEPAAGDTPFVAMINGARVTVEMTMYELTDTRVERALAAAAHRGVTVRVLLDDGYYGSGSETNVAAYGYLHDHRVQVRWAASDLAFTHQKTLTVDGRESAIMTLNLTSTADTRDFAVLDAQPADVQAIQRTFDADFAHQRISPPSGTGDLIWSPGAAAIVLSLINAAHGSIDLENEEMAYKPAISALCAAAVRHVTVQIVMTYSSDARSALVRLQGCRAHVHLFHGQRPLYIHGKLLVIDDRVALVGSQNLSTTSLSYNRELSIRTTSPALLRSLALTFAGDYAAAPAMPN
jgi:cardiolipin synthase